MIDFETYKLLMENRPFKFPTGEVNYRKADDEHECRGCAHFFTRKLDGFTVCEVTRPADGDEAIDPRYVCDFWTDDGQEYPFQDG